jgi:NTE family protein
MDDTLSLKIKNDLNKILGDYIVNVKIDEEFDIPEYVSKSHKIKKTILVLSGGGIKGLCHIGALQALKDLELLDNITEFAGTSVGSLIIGLYLVGYKPESLWEFFKKFDLKKLLNINFLNLLSDFGLDDGKSLDYVLKKLLSMKGCEEDFTLHDLYLKCNKKFTFTSVCWNTGKVVYMTHKNFPNLPLWQALRMSSAIPIFYCKIKYDGLLYMDGGCIDNYPIQLFKDKIDQVIGIYLEEELNYSENPQNIEEDLARNYEIIIKGVNFGCKKGFEKYTIDIPFNDIISINYNIDNKTKDQLYSKGYNLTKEHLFS